ncbi:MAG TPA: D-2-hydroxyacid dehydrogenase family protein [Sphingomonas sp.]|uniref:D-2-hydroxyacid dehydrogenase family protein n=1 Tax=Sphingomonas sp. TaxID=28214 RepID=UPI002C7C44DA|nr:D-2-hydroxyacid dehydrogenase family protein [Sphingomonas sp.]HMI19143.1 D-2-hydroxyacid dehydrogenase family protein [Sphingomonas sp.]
MLKVAVLDDYQRVAKRFADWSKLESRCSVEIFDRHLGDIDEAIAALIDFDIICLLRERMAMPAALIERLPKLKLICATGAHNRTLDLQAAQAQGIVVSHTRNASTENPTAELTWGLILSAARRIDLENRNVRTGGWQTTVGLTLHGRTLGVLGLGRLGKVVARIGAAFGMEIIAWSPNLTEERAAEAGVRLVSKSELFAESDVVTIHMVLSEATRGLVGAEELALLGEDGILVNTSRGPIVHEDALIAALRERRLGLAALDTFDVEPLPEGHPFRAMENVLATPHLGYVTAETYQVFYPDVVENIEAFLSGRPIRLLQH